MSMVCPAVSVGASVNLTSIAGLSSALPSLNFRTESLAMVPCASSPTTLSEAYSALVAAALTSGESQNPGTVRPFVRGQTPWCLSRCEYRWHPTALSCQMIELPGPAVGLPSQAQG